MIQAVIFDCFGVLTINLWAQFKDTYFAQNPGLLAQAIALNKQADRGDISYKQLTEQAADLAGIPAARANFLPASSAANELLFAYITNNLKPKYKIGMLSNAAGNYLESMFSAEMIQLFDMVVLSCDVGMIKPEPGIYQYAVEKLGVEPRECVFIDDNGRYCQAARDFGMKAIHYGNFEQFKNELEQLLVDKT